VLPCTQETPTCGDTCGRTLECGAHVCSRSCHRDKCGSVRNMSVLKHISTNKCFHYSYVEQQECFMQECIVSKTFCLILCMILGGCFDEVERLFGKLKQLGEQVRWD
jgi:hypothetical protein